MKLILSKALVAILLVTISADGSVNQIPTVPVATLPHKCDCDCSKPQVDTVTETTPTKLDREINWDWFLYVAATLMFIGIYGHCRFIHSYFSLTEMQTPEDEFLVELIASDLIFLLKIPPLLFHSTVGLAESGNKLATFLETLGGTGFAGWALAIAGERCHRVCHWENIFDGIQWPLVSLINHTIRLISIFSAVIPLLLNTSSAPWIPTAGEIISQITPLTFAVVLCVLNWLQMWQNDVTFIFPDESIPPIPHDDHRLEQKETEAMKTHWLGIMVTIRGIITVARWTVLGSEHLMWANLLGWMQIDAVATTPFLLLHYLNRLRENAEP